MKKYETPVFDVTVYEIENEVALNISTVDPDGDDEDWWG